MRLTCLWIRNKLSRYMDGELPAWYTGAVKKHLSLCPACRQHLKDLQRVGGLLLQLPAPQVAPHLWTRLRERAFQAGKNRTPSFTIRRGHPARLLLGAALVVLFLLVIVLLPELPVFRNSPLVLNHVAALDLGPYLDELNSSRSSGEFELKHQAVLVSPEEARQRCHFPVQLPAFLHNGYRLTNTKLLTSVCCFVAWAQYRKGDRVVEVFQLPPRHPISFGNRRAVEEILNGIQYHQIQAGQYHVLSWPGPNFNVTLVSNLEEDELRGILKELAGR